MGSTGRIVSPMSGALGMRANHRLRAEAVEQDQALVIIADVEVLAQRPGGAVLEDPIIGLDSLPRLALRKLLVRGDARHLIHRPLIANPRIQQGQRPEGSAVVRDARENVLR